MTVKQIFRTSLVVASVLTFSGLAPTSNAQVPNEPGVPTIISDNPPQTQGQKETHFLTFLGSFIPESAASAKAYYKAINPSGSKQNFTAWLVNAGFIHDVSEWNPSGPQTVIHDPAQHGFAKILADSHVIVLNAADLGFVRNQYIRCVPNCTAKNPIIYTYLENYAVAPFAAGGSGFPFKSGYPTQAEADAAIQSAANRPLGVLGGNGTDPCLSKQNAGNVCIERIADVAFEWAPPETNPTSSARFGQLYAYIFNHFGPGAGGITETLTSPDATQSHNPLVGAEIPDFTNLTGPTLTIQPGDPFPPNLDFQGFKQHPGVCFICHGGKPTNLVSGKYPRSGNVDGFRFLPVDAGNLMFTSSGPFSLAGQQADMKKYNQAVLLTVDQSRQSDGTGAVRQPHLAEVIKGWYAGFPGDQNMTGANQDSTFTPLGWREPQHGGTAPAGSEQLYHQVVAESCRSCHFNREVSLDFGTAANFGQESDLLQLALLPECPNLRPNIYSIDPKLRPMPLALLTFQRMWEAENTPRTLGDGTVIFHTVDQLKNHFGFHSRGAYCATNP